MSAGDPANLTRDERLELASLCDGLVDETLTDAQGRRLAEWLRASEDARGYYVRRMGQSASLCHYASEMQADAADATEPAARVRVRGAEVREARFWPLAFIGAAASLAAAFWAANASVEDAGQGGRGGESVARLTASGGTLWGTDVPAPRLGDRLMRGQRIELSAGFAEVTFDSGAQVVLEGPAALDINSPWQGTLRSGGLRAVVPSQAIGFRISYASVEVVDFGTEFTMRADAGGSADVAVIRGEVEAAPRDGGDSDPILLRERDSRHFGADAVAAAAGDDPEFARLSRPLSLDHVSPVTRYVRWSMRDAEGGAVLPELFGMTGGAEAFHLKLVDSGGAGAAGGIASLADRAHPRVLRFDGQTYGSAAFPNLSGSGPHTVAYWVRVPADAPLSDAYAMVAWNTNVRKLALRPVHVSWNRNPGDGPIGALRTDFGGGSALGTTSLRDGRWHHVAVVFAPGGDDGRPVQVRQYLDGRLESSSVNPPRRSQAGSVSKVTTPVAAIRDTLWLGCRLGASGMRRERFRGEIDDLIVADAGLGPADIVLAMAGRRLGAADGTGLARNGGAPAPARAPMTGQ